MTRPTTAPCRLGITTATLSELRDDTLTTAEARSLRAHVPTCAACQARLAGFDRVARALHLQRDLEPDGRLWASVQPRIMRQEGAYMPTIRRPVIGGVFAALSVILVVVLFAMVLQQHHSSGPATATQSPTGTTPGPTASPPTKPTPGPTATPITLTGLPTPQQAWGAGAAAATVNVSGLTVAGITADGQHILGYQLSTDGANYDIGWLSVATHDFTTFDQSPVNGQLKRNNPPNCCVTDGRFVVGANGTSQGSSTNAPWYYDTQTGQRHPINSNEFFAFGLHDGVAYHLGPLTGPKTDILYGLNLLSGADTAITGTPSIANIGNFVWPEFAYTTSIDGGNTFIQHIHNLQTNADVALTSLGNVAGAPNGAAPNGDTAFIVPPTSTAVLQEWDQVFTAGTTPRTVAALVGTINMLTGANARVVLVSVTEASCTSAAAACNYSLAWDRTLHQTVLLSPSDNTSVWLAGDYFAVVDHKTNQLTLYDTSRFPTH